MDNKVRGNESKQHTDTRKFVLIFTYNGILYDAIIKDISYPAGNYFSVEFSYGQKKGFIPKLHCIDPVKLKWDSEDFADKTFCQTVGHAIALYYKKQYLLLQNK
jgi:hypothetical protein